MPSLRDLHCLGIVITYSIAIPYNITPLISQPRMLGTVNGSFSATRSR
jgi:hypothetical protein